MRAASRMVDRVVPPLLLAAGVTLVGAGLLSFGGRGPDPRTTDPGSGPAVARPTITPGGSDVSPSASDRPPVASEPGSSVPPASPPGSTADPSASGSPEVIAEATRVVIPSQGIDLPVISRLRRVPGQGPDRYPPCDVALFHDAFGQPGQEGTTYLYAHAQVGMFAPLLEASRDRDGEALIGALVQVYTDDDRRYVYRIDEVKRHALDFSIADAAPGERQVVLQTSEGPHGTVEKLQVAAGLLSEDAADHADAHPRARPRACFPG